MIESTTQPKKSLPEDIQDEIAILPIRYATAHDVRELHEKLDKIIALLEKRS